MAVSGYLAMESEEKNLPPALQGRGWKPVTTPCAGLVPGFYEVESQEESREIYVADDAVLASHVSPWPDSALLCRPIPEPSHIQEIP